MYFQELQKFLDEAVEGVLYFSLGNNMRSDHMPEEERRVFIEAFSELPQKILWKWESARLPGQPANVKIGTWLPQQDILGNMTLCMIDYIHYYEASTITMTRVTNFFLGQKATFVFMGDSQNTHGKIIMPSIHNGLNYCIMFTIYT
jgi:hypothetical protein